MEVTLGPWSDDDDDGWWVLTKFQNEQIRGETRDKELIIDATDRNLNILVSLSQGHKGIQMIIYQFCHEVLKDSRTVNLLAMLDSEDWLVRGVSM